MTIDKAIEMLTQLTMGTDPVYLPDVPDAIKLGIEALKVVKEFRTGRYKTINSPLPGETTE